MRPPQTLDQHLAGLIFSSGETRARLAWRLADEDAWPFARTDQEELDRERAEYDKSEVRQVEEAVAQLRRQRGDKPIQ